MNSRDSIVAQGNPACPLRFNQANKEESIHCIKAACAWWARVPTWTYGNGSHDYEECCAIKGIALKENDKESK